MPGRMGANDPKRRLLHVDGDTCFPHRQAENGLIIGNGDHVELAFFVEKPIFDAGIDRLTLWREAEIRQLLGIGSYKVAISSEIFLGSELRRARAADDMPFVNEHARDAMGVEYDLRLKRFIKFFVHWFALPRHESVWSDGCCGSVCLVIASGQCFEAARHSQGW